MKKSKKLFTALVAVVMTVVALTAAVTAVLSAQNQTVTSSLSVTYVANNVKADVAVYKKAQGGSFGAAAASQSFAPTEASTTKTLNAGDAVALGGSPFARYAVYQFKFQNTYADSTGTAISVKGTYTQPEAANRNNVVLKWIVSTGDTEPVPTMTDSETSGDWNAFTTANGNSEVSVTSGTQFNISTSLAANSAVSLYLFVGIVNTTLGATFTLAASNLSFALANV